MVPGLAIVPEMGMIIPEMGKARGAVPSGIAQALFSPVQQRVLRLLFAQPNRRFQSGELIRLVGSGTGAAHRVLTRLAGAGLINVTRTGNQKHYRANRESPVFPELHGLIVKTVGAVEPLQRALSSKARQIDAAFVYGSMAKATETARSDIDLMVISDTLTYADLFDKLQPVEGVLARRVNVNVMGRREWRTKVALKGSFAARIAAEPRQWVIGSDDDVA